MQYTDVFGVALRDARTRAGKSQGDVAKFLSVSVTYLSDVENGRRAPLTRERLMQVARYLDVDAAFLLKASGAWHGEIGLPVLDAHRDEVAALLSVRWASLPQDALERIASEVRR